LSEYEIANLIYKHYGVNWLGVKYDLDTHEMLCLTAQALEAEEKEQYKWWVNSQQDPKKFKWAKDRGNAFQKLLNLAEIMTAKNSGKQIRGTPQEFIKATGAKFVYMNNDRQFFDPDKNPIEFNPRLNKNTVVLRLDE
jgi:hypothetical protein